MAKIYKRSDRLKVKLDDVTVTFSPLTVDQKSEAQAVMGAGRLRSDVGLITKGIALALKYAVKNIEGVVDNDGNPYKLEFDNDCLKDSSVDDLLNLEIHSKLVMVCSQLLNSIPKLFTDEKGNKIEGVEIVEKDSESKPIPN